jgi:hypothetical protein
MTGNTQTLNPMTGTNAYANGAYGTTQPGFWGSSTPTVFGTQAFQTQVPMNQLNPFTSSLIQQQPGLFGQPTQQWQTGFGQPSLQWQTGFNSPQIASQAILNAALQTTSPQVINAALQNTPPQVINTVLQTTPPAGPAVHPERAGLPAGLPAGPGAEPAGDPVDQPSDDRPAVLRRGADQPGAVRLRRHDRRRGLQPGPVREQLPGPDGSAAVPAGPDGPAAVPAGSELRRLRAGDAAVGPQQRGLPGQLRAGCAPAAVVQHHLRHLVSG